MTDITPTVRADLAPTGRLRAGINYGNVILATKDPVTGESSGVAIDVMQDVARRLGVPAEIVAYDSVAAMGDAAPTNAWDIAFLGADPQREKLMGFTAAYLEIDATYLVARPSPLRTVAEVDRAGVRVAAPARANYELFLSRNLTQAQLDPRSRGRVRPPRDRGGGCARGPDAGADGSAPEVPWIPPPGRAVHGRPAGHRGSQGPRRRPRLPAARRRGRQEVGPRCPRDREDRRARRLRRTARRLALGAVGWRSTYG